MNRRLIPLCALVLLALAAFVGPGYESFAAPDQQTPSLPQADDPPAIVLADGVEGLTLVSAPVTLPLTVGHITYLPVEVRNYHRPITISGQIPIHTYVNDSTAVSPTQTVTLTVGVLTAAHGKLKLQTLRMRPHDVTLTFSAGAVEHEAATAPQSSSAPFAPSALRDLRVPSRLRDPNVPLTLIPATQPHTPLFGIHGDPFYDGILQPFDRVWGPQCGVCPTTPGDPAGSTRDIACAKQQLSCHCRPMQEIFDPAADVRVRRRAPEMQRYASQLLRSIGGWGTLQFAPGEPPQYLWNGLDWLFGLPSAERDYSPLFTGLMAGDFGWMTCPAYTNPDGSTGFFDPNNSYLVEQYRLHVRQVANRYAPELRFFETTNEPCYNFYLCPCLDDPRGPAIACNAPSGPNQYVCDFMTRPYGHESEEFAQVYGPFLSVSANVASEELAAVNPDAILVAGPVEKSRAGLTATTRTMIEHGLLDRGNVAVMIHQFPYPSPPNWIEHEPCVYGPNYYLPPGCETAPPMEDYVTPGGRPIAARAKWQEMDEAMDVGEILQDAQELGVLDRFYFFDTELHAGFFVKDETTTTGRATIAGLRVGAINAHQRFVGMEFIGANADPTAYNLLVKHLAGATPVYSATAPLIGDDYSGLVAKFFTRPADQAPANPNVPGIEASAGLPQGSRVPNNRLKPPFQMPSATTFGIPGQAPRAARGEDIIAFWSNASAPLTLTLAAHPARFEQVTLTRFTAPVCPDVSCAGRRDRFTIASAALTAPPTAVAVQPLYDFYFLSVISDRPGFGWLAEWDDQADHRLHLPLLLRRGVPIPPTPTPTAATRTPTPTATRTPTVTPTPTPSSTPAAAIVLADGPGGLTLVSAPLALPITVGHVISLPVEVLSYHRPITVNAQTWIHTYVNDQTASSPTQTVTLTIGLLTAAQGEITLQTLRMRPHGITLTFSADATPPLSFMPFALRDLRATSRLRAPNVPLTLMPLIQPHTPLFAVHPDTPAFSGLTQPFDRVWGSQCGVCPTTPGDPPGSTRDIACAKQQPSCSCHPIQEILDPETDARVRRRAPALQRYAFQFMRGAGGWGSSQPGPDTYLWPGLDWLFDALPPTERDYSPVFTGLMDGNFGWMTCPAYTNPDGSTGFFDAANRYLVGQYAANLQANVARYRPELRFIELSNEPAAEYYLCPCVAPGGTCHATSGPNQPACLLGPNSPEFVATYGDLLFTAAISGSHALAAANPDALLVTGALDLPPNDFGLSLTTQNMITRGLLLNGNVAIGIHQYPYPYPNWRPEAPNCAYYQVPGDPYWLPPGCETAPPFDDFTTPGGRLIHGRDIWRIFDSRVDLSLQLRDAADLGVLERLYTFDTELHAGWHDSDPTTTPAREAMAGLRIAAINAHQRVLGTEFIFAPADPTAYNLVVKQLAGVTPVYTTDAPLMDADYSDLVVKRFTRGREDIIAVWSNAATPLSLTLAPGPAHFGQVTLTRFADAGGPLQISISDLDAPPPAVAVQPLREFYFLSVISDQPGFGWLDQLRP